MSEPLVARVRALLTRALESHPHAPSADMLRAARAGMDEPLRVAIAGKVKAGKSTLLNALVGETLAPTDAGECTRIVTWYQNGITYRVTMYARDGLAEPVRFDHDGAALQIDLGTRTPDEVERLVVEWPSAPLRDTTMIDTPGIASLSAAVSQRSEQFLGRDEEGPTTADAVLYLMRHLHSTDVDFLEAFRDDIGEATPVNAIGVLARADEVSGGRLDGMISARRIAARYRDDPKIRRLCQTVVPVAGLLAQAGTTLTQGDYETLDRIARAPQIEADALLLTADRFAYADTDLELTHEARADLLEHFGLFGIRLATTLIRENAVHTAAELAEELVVHSGVGELREVLQSRFAARRDVLKARSGLLALQVALRTPAFEGDAELAVELERVVAGAHEFAEMHLLNACRNNAVAFRGDEVPEVERLLGASGASVSERLGLSGDANVREIQEALSAAMLKWQTRAESPMSTREVVDAARVLVRTCEGLSAMVVA